MKIIDADEIVYESIDSSDTAEYEYEHGTGIFAVRKEDIDAMPTIQPEPHWIPCSKRLPEKEGLYLVTEIYKYSDGRKEYEVNVDRWSRNGSGREWSMCSNDMIFAWMPLPEPYKGVTT